jgi:hypothetical protein
MHDGLGYNTGKMQASIFFAYFFFFAKDSLI